MAEVTGMTAAAIEALMDDMIVSADIDENGQMIFTKRGGGTVNAGPIISPDIAVEQAWPIGSVFIGAVTTNPNTLLGIGTWVRFAQGKTLVSQLDDDPNFGAIMQEGGVASVILTQAQMPVHTHVQNQHRHTPQTRTYFGVYNSSVSMETVGGIGGEGWAMLQTTGSAGGESATEYATATNQNAGGGEAHTNLQPYITVYMWRRTA